MYIGRFAPSPTGPLHIGSLITAVASFLDARSHGGRWQVRIEDVDTPREQPGAADSILRALEDFALYWDGPVLYQNQRLEAYREAIERLRVADHTFACACTRREIADSALPGQEGPIYPGTCRNGFQNGQPARALRVRVDSAPIGFTDRLHGCFEQDLAGEVGDFVIVRADGLMAYQLAVVVDDAAQGITHVVRGSDLLFSTPRQILLQQLLGYATPSYLHVPVAVDATGEKLSKQTYAPGIETRNLGHLACVVLDFLGQNIPPEAEHLPLEQLWTQAARQWNPQRLPQLRQRLAPDIGATSLFR
ncbi:MAG: tRNA glutamyl-Q(34) synthetase GluQRS [Gammaproteobacteria bacterium]|nr:tRNA glutamyl-Q(34) synthetase GluQRS [Gammaproteobacteria bacterium]